MGNGPEPPDGNLLVFCSNRLTTKVIQYELSKIRNKMPKAIVLGE